MNCFDSNDFVFQTYFIVHVCCWKIKGKEYTITQLGNWVRILLNYSWKTSESRQMFHEHLK